METTIERTELEQEWYEEGFDRGYSIASWVDIPENLEGCAEYCGCCETELARVSCWMVYEAGEAEANGRQYSPFEFTAHEINSLDGENYEHEGAAEAVWAAFDEGIADGIEAEISPRLVKYFR